MSTWTGSGCSSMARGFPFSEHKCGHVLISNLSVSCHVLSAGQPTSENPRRPHLLPHSSLCFPRKSCSGPGRAVTEGKAFLHQSWLSAVKRCNDTREPRPSVILSAATQYTHHRPSDRTAAVTQSRVLCVVPVCPCRWTDGVRGGRKRAGDTVGESAVGFCLYPRSLRLVHAEQ